MIGGPGSGRRPDKTCVSECRVVSIGELAGGARRRPHPAGEIVWVAQRSRETQARLTYTITEEHWPPGPDLSVLALRYWPTLSAAESRERIILVAGKPGLADCPGCDEPVRKLYAPPGAEHFLCRSCHDLVYRKRPGPDRLAELQTAMGPLLHGLYADHALIAGQRSPAQRRKAAKELLQTLEDERPLAPEELRVWCLRLGKLGLSCRTIARLTGTSKSSVQRYLAAGAAAIDRTALARERLERYHDSQLPALGGLSLLAQVRLLDRHAKQQGLYRSAAAEPEEMVFL
jgi:hypothetical protein